MKGERANSLKFDRRGGSGSMKGSTAVIVTLKQSHNIPSVLYPGNFWSRYTGLGTQKLSPKNRAVLYPKVYFLSNS